MTTNINRYATSKTNVDNATAAAGHASSNNEIKAMKSPIDIFGIDHVVLKVDDLEGMAEWYKTVLGCKVAKHNKGAQMIHLDAGSSLLDLVDNAGPLGSKNGNDGEKPNGYQKMDHFCLGLKEFDEKAIREYLSANGVEITTELGVRYGKNGDGESLFFKDPEGNRIEIKKSLYM